MGRKAVYLCSSHLPVSVGKVALGDAECVGDLGIVYVVLGLRVPLGQLGQGELAVSAAHEEDEVNVLVVLGRHGLEPLSARRVVHGELQDV